MSKGKSYNWKAIVCKRINCIYSSNPFQCNFNHTEVDPDILLNCFERLNIDQYRDILDKIVYTVRTDEDIFMYLKEKTILCPHVNNAEGCIEGKNCMYYHSDREKNINNIITMHLIRNGSSIRSVKWENNPGIVCRNEKVNSDCFGKINNCTYVSIHTHEPTGTSYIVYKCMDCCYRDKYVIV